MHGRCVTILSSNLQTLIQRLCKGDSVNQEGVECSSLPANELKVCDPGSETALLLTAIGRERESHQAEHRDDTWIC